MAGGDDRVLAGDRPRRRPDLPFVAGRPFEADDLGVAVDLGAAIARALSERLGHVGGSDMAVLPMVEPAKDAPAMLDERPQLPDLVRRQDLGVDPLRRRRSDVPPILVAAGAIWGAARRS